MKSSQITDVSETIPVPIIRGLCQTLMMGTEMVPEMLVILNQLKWLIDIIKFVVTDRGLHILIAPGLQQL
jgi:hypothetical protein